MTSFPTLHTERLELRQFRHEDADQVQRLAGAKEIAQFTTLPHPYKDGMAAAWIKQQHADFAAMRIVNFAIVRRADDELIGSIGLTLSEAHQRGELGFWIGGPYWNNGYCTEAAHKVIEYGFKALNLHRIFALHYGRNAGSGKVLQKLGMQYEGTQSEHFLRFGVWEDSKLYGLLKSTYEAVEQ